MGNVVQKPKQSFRNFKRKHSIFTCQICCELKKKKFKHSRWKSHRICLDCMESYISVQVYDSCSKIKCPHPKCKKTMDDPLRYRSMISPLLFKNWVDLLCKETIRRLEGVYCPFSDCSVPILNECWDNAGKTMCPNCLREFCYKCQVPWSDKCCDERKRRREDENDDLFHQLAIAQSWIRCPSCFSVVERVSGCSKVKCRCGVYFCYTCGKKIDDHHSKGQCPTS